MNRADATSVVEVLQRSTREVLQVERDVLAAEHAPQEAQAE